jgi:GNAT superfamily N-acetyltransferase
MDVTIRVADEWDAATVAGLSAELWAEDSGTRVPYMDQGWPARSGLEYYRDAIADPNGSVWLVIDVSGTAVGFAHGRLGGPHETRPVVVAELESMYVKPEARSGGVGAELIAVFRDWARQRGAQRIRVSAYAANERAVAFYRRHGFAPQSLRLEADA